MSDTTISGMRPAAWRILHKLLSLRHGAGAGAHPQRSIKAVDLIHGQEAAPEYLTRLADAGLIVPKVGGEFVPIQDIRRLHSVNVALSTAGLRRVQTTAYSLVIRVLSTPEVAARQVRHVLDEAIAEQGDLFGMHKKGFIEAWGCDGEVIALDDFRRIPPTLVVRLTRRGRLFVAK